MINGLQNTVSDYKEPLYDVKELRSIAPTDLKQPFDIRSVIARIVDGSEFDEFKKLYGTVRSFVIGKSMLTVGFDKLRYANSYYVFADPCDWLC